MITLYLDNQIFSYLKNKDNPTYFQGLNGKQKMATAQKFALFLKEQKQNFLIFYSNAHLLDLSNDESGNTNRLIDDLEHRNEFVDNNYLVYSQKEKITKYLLVHPKEAFEPYWEKHNETAIDFSDFLDLSQLEGFVDEEKMTELKSQIELLQNSRFPGINQLTPPEHQNSVEFQKLQEMFSFMEGANFFDLMNGFMKFSDQFQNEKGFYKGLRDIVHSGVEKTKDLELSNDTSAIVRFILDLTEIDLDSPEKEQFVKTRLLDVVKEQWSKINGDKEPSTFDLHYQAYLTLDIMGIEPEESTKIKKARARNMLYDGQHSFYGGHCEFVISEDAKFRAKSQLLYKLFGLSTRVLSMEDFIKESFAFKLEEISNQFDFNERVLQDLKHAFISSSRLSTMFSHVQELKPAMKYLHYFNQILKLNENGEDYLIFRHDSKTYLGQLPYKVIQEICDKAFLVFGLDAFGKSIYNLEEETHQIQQKKWNGRTWYCGDLLIMLQLNPSGNHLQLVLGTYN